MTDLTRDHPAVEVGAHAYAIAFGEDWHDYSVGMKLSALDDLAVALTAAIPHLTADDLRHTPAGKALMAEGWEVGVQDGINCTALPDDAPDIPNPYREDQP